MERERAGRPSKGLQRTKVTVYTDTRDLLNQYAEEFDMPVVELLHESVKDPDFKKLLDKIKD